MMHTNVDITLYRYDKNGNINRLHVIGKNGKKGALWDEVKQSSILKSGLTGADTIKIMIPASHLPEGMTFATAKDMVVKEVIDFEIDNTTEATRSASLKELKAAHTVYGINAADAKLYGSPGMQHYQLSCK
ncbi:hypothetical protein HNQ56_003740 [Anaerotaenia torta]|uniref:DUF6751 family protein n=1 Tax=Anaerotaenia torta TaxID=433293 RepID=UPI003D25BFE1